MIPRIVPVLLLSGGGLVKTVQFKSPKYIGDPVNAVRIFSEKEADELILLDIHASTEGRGPDEATIEEIASEAFMPIAYGGGVHTVATATRLVQLGIEKVVINAGAVDHPEAVAQIADRLGRSTLILAFDARRRADGTHEVVLGGGSRSSGIDVRSHAEALVALGAGELFLNSVDRDGTMNGYDLDLVRAVTGVVEVPVIACGGAGSTADLVAVVREGGASAAGAGSLFVFHGKHRAVLITYPPYELRASLFADLPASQFAI